jgi:hypothetical protein
VAGGQGSITPTQGTYDEGTQVTLTAQPAPGYRVGSWSGTDNDSSTASTNTVTMSADRTVTVTFEKIPLAVDAGPDRTIATGQHTQLAVSVSGGLGPYAVSWSPAAGLSNTTSMTPTAAPAATTTYTATVTDALEQTAADSVVVTVSASLSVEAGPDQTIGAGGSTVLTATVIGGIGPYTFRWAPIAGLSAADVANPTASPSETTTYIVTVTDGALATASDSVMVVVGEGATLTVTIAADGIAAQTLPARAYAMGQGVDVYVPDAPQPGYVFDHWAGDASGSDNPVRVYMDGNKSVEAVYVPSGASPQVGLPALCGFGMVEVIAGSVIGLTLMGRRRRR